MYDNLLVHTYLKEGILLLSKTFFNLACEENNGIGLRKVHPAFEPKNTGLTKEKSSAWFIEKSPQFFQNKVSIST